MKNKIFIAALALSFGFLACNPAGAKDTGAEKKDVPVAEKQAKSSPQVVDKPINLTKAEFLKKVMNYEKNQTEWVYEGDKPAIVDFWAEWCGPCKKAAPVLEQLAKEYAGEIYVYKVNTDQERELSSVFGIRGIPAFLWIPMEGKPSMTSGVAKTDAETKQMFKGLIDEILLKKTNKSE